MVYSNNVFGNAPHNHTRHSSAISPSQRHSKPFWHETHRKHVLLAKTSQSQTVLIGDSIVAGLKRYESVWAQFKPTNSLNFGVAGDRIQHVLWRAMNIQLNSSTKYIVIHCGTNNLDSDDPCDIANGIISIGLTFQNKYAELKILISPLLPRDPNKRSIRRTKIFQINAYLCQSCENLEHFHFIPQDPDWCNRDGYLQKKFYYLDNLHLVEAGNHKFASSILRTIQKLKNVNESQNNHIHRPQSCSLPSYSRSRSSTLDNTFDIGKSEFGSGWDGLSTSSSSSLSVHCSISRPMSTISVPCKLSRSISIFNSPPSQNLRNSTLENNSEDEYAIGQSECLGRGWDGPTSKIPSSTHTPPTLDDFPPLPPPLAPLPTVYPVLSHVKRQITRSRYGSFSCSPSVSSSVSFPLSISNTNSSDISSITPVKCNVFRPAPINCNVSKSTQISHILPLKKLNKVKPPKWEKCDYVLPSSAIPESYSIPPAVSRPMSRRVKRSVSRRVNQSLPSPVNNCVSSSILSSDVQDDEKSTIYRFLLVFNILHLLLSCIKDSFSHLFNICRFNLISILYLFFNIFVISFYLNYLLFRYFKNCMFYIFFTAIFMHFIFIPTNHSFLNADIYDTVPYNMKNSNLSFNNDFTDFNDYSMAYNNNIFFYNKTVKPMSVLTNLSPKTKNRNPIEFFCIILLLIFYFKTKGKPIFNIFHFAMLFFLFNNISLHTNHRDKDLNSCTNLEFFTIESINICNNINKYHLKNNFNLLSFSKFKKKENPFLFQHLLLISGDISLNPGPTHEYQLNNETWSPFKKRGLHFLHININSLIPKIEELRSIAEKSKAAVIGITETKLDKSVLNSEVDIENYVIIRCDRNRNGGGVACYIRSDICFNELHIFSNEVENICFNIFLKNLQPISIGVFYRPPNQSRFLEEISNDFNKLYTEKNEVIILGDLNINLLQNSKYILNIKNSRLSENVTTHPLLKQYQEFISTFGLTQLIKHPTRITCETSTLIDHILINSNEKISQYGVIDIGISDHQMIYCTRKLIRNKTGDKKYIESRSLKKYSVDVYESALKDLDFPNYETFTDIDLAYSDFIQKLTNLLDNIAPLKKSRVKNNSQEWFDGEIAEQIVVRDKNLKLFKKSKLHIDREIYLESKKKVTELIKLKKHEFFENKLNENIGNPKDLWKTIRNLGLPKKASGVSNICLKQNGKSVFNPIATAEIFKDFFSNIASNLASKLPAPTNKFGNHFISSYYKKLNIKTNFNFTTTTEQTVLKILKDLKTSKAPGIDNIKGMFLRDGANILAVPIAQLCNLSMSTKSFPSNCKIAKLKPLFKKGSRTDPKNYRPISLLPLISKIMEKVVHEQTNVFLNENKIFFKFQSGFRSNHSTSSCLSYLNDKILKGFDSGLLTWNDSYRLTKGV